MRGEDHTAPTKATARRGSPPHARGRPSSPATDGTPYRITPACAGKTRKCSHRPSTVRDHPRMRGEDFNLDQWQAGDRGSPPHARGRRTASLAVRQGRGITPACAGKTSVSRRFMTPGRDHPRMRGEDCAEPSYLRPRLGSPPHARGRPLDGEDMALAARDHPRMRGEDPKSSDRPVDATGSPPHARGRLCRGWFL